MFLGRRREKQRERTQQRRQDRMSTEKEVVRQKQYPTGKRNGVIDLVSLGNSLSGAPQGVNTNFEYYVTSLKGSSTSPNMWELNLSSQPGEQKRLLTVMAASTFLVNYSQADYPSRIDITVGEIAGTTDQTGLSTHSIATLVPKGPAVSVINPGGIVGFNVQYGLLSEPRSFDISHIPLLTFNVTIGQTHEPAEYPLSEAIIVDFQVAHVTF